MFETFGDPLIIQMFFSENLPENHEGGISISKSVQIVQRKRNFTIITLVNSEI